MDFLNSVGFVIGLLWFASVNNVVYSLWCGGLFCGFGARQDTCLSDHCMCKDGYRYEKNYDNPELFTCTEMCTKDRRCSKQNFECVGGVPMLGSCRCPKGFRLTSAEECIEI